MSNCTRHPKVKTPRPGVACRISGAYEFDTLGAWMRIHNALTVTTSADKSTPTTSELRRKSTGSSEGRSETSRRARSLDSLGGSGLREDGVSIPRSCGSGRCGRWPRWRRSTGRLVHPNVPTGTSTTSPLPGQELHYIHANTPWRLQSAWAGRLTRSHTRRCVIRRSQRWS